MSKSSQVILYNSKPYKVSQKAGRNQLRVTLPIPDGTRIELNAPSLQELQEKANELYGLSRTDTLGWYFEHVWCPTRAHVRPETLNKDAWAFGKYILPRFAATPLVELDRATLQRAFNEWGGELEPSTLRILRGKLSNLLNLAVLDGAVPNNQVRGVRLPPLKRRDGIPLTVEDVRAAINHPSIGVRSLARLLALGFRASEACGIKRSDIKNGVIHFREQRKDGRVSRPKNEYSMRDVPLPKGLEAELLADSGAVYIATTEEGHPPSHSQAGRITKQVNPNASAHDFRRLFETILESELEAPVSVADALAGRKPKTVGGLYRMPSIETKRKWVERYWEQVSTDRPQLFADKGQETG